MMKRTGGAGRKAEQTEERMKGERGWGVEEKKKKWRGTTITFIVYQSANYSIIY